MLASALPAEARSQAPPEPGLFTELLQEIVVDSLVDYEMLLERRPLLDRYVDALGRTDPSRLEVAPREEQLAFWINAYNACMLYLVADHYPIRRGGAGLLGNIANLFAGRPANSVWQIRDVFTRDFCPVAGEERSLDEIEHEIIRPVFEEPRIHFAVNCAAYSCPRLAPEAYSAEDLEEQLDRQVELFIQDRRHFRLENGESPTLRLNRVLDWFSEDFGGVEGLPAFFAPYLSEDDRRAVLHPDLEVRFIEYDWTLNDIRVDHGNR